jgi:hypothetical protein
MSASSTTQKVNIMSAWLCNEEHIYEIAFHYVRNCQQYTQSQNKLSVPQAVKILWKANNDSLASRYGDDVTPMNLLPDYKPMVNNIFHMAKLVDCYMYQSCEFDEWEDSKAYKICESVKDSLLRNSPEYEAAPWGFHPDEYKSILDKKAAS